MSATLTHRPEAPASNRVPTPNNVRRRGLVAGTAAVAIAVAVGIAVTAPTVDDGSSQFAEAQRMAALSIPLDTSVQYAEDLRFAAAGAAVTVDGSNQFAETQRLHAAAANTSVDTSHEVAESQRMQALDDSSWEQAERRRMASLDPTN